MSGMKTLGNFCHQLENLYEGLAASRFEPSPHLFKLLEKCHDRIAVMLDSVGTRGQSLPVDDLVQAIKTYCANPSIDYASSSQKDGKSTEVSGSELSIIDESVDAEVINIFMMEAEELIETIDHCIHDWKEDPANLKMLDELQRAMHTLKGGARLAGLGALATLSHDCETYLNNVKHQGIPFDSAFFAGLLKRQDEIVAKLTQVIHSPTSSLPEPALGSEKVTADILTFVARKEADAPKSEAPERRTETREPKESVKVGSELLESLVNLAGETSIARGRIEQGVLDFIGSLTEMESTVLRVKNQLLELDTETQAQITSRHTLLGGREYEEFDPLEMDRYSKMQQLSRSLIETASDLLDLKETLSNKAKDTETLLIQQARINTDLQEGLMRTRMVPFSGMVPRLRRIIRQVSAELNKQVEFDVINAEGEMDRTVLERMVAPLEHMLRNAVDHGIEMPDERKKNKKPEAGLVQLKFGRSGGDVVLELSDDGGGINIDAVRAKAVKLGLIDANSTLPDQEVLQFIMHAGFSTAQKVTQISGRGVGMDVVNSEIKQLGGTMRIQSVRGVGTRFSVHLPFTVSMNRALMVRLGEDMYAVPLNTMRGVVRMNPYQLETYYQPNAPLYEYGGEKYRVQYLGSLLDHTVPPKIPQGVNSVSLILVPHETQPTALQIDGLMGSREIVVKTVGPQFGSVSGLSGATILGDGNVVVILDFQALIYSSLLRRSESTAHIPTATEVAADKAATANERILTVMVVDDSVTVRKVTSRVLERHGMTVITAKDGVDALQQLDDVIPDIMLLDIEMPRKDGFEVATEIRQNPRLKHLPIIMITSRTGDKHRDRAKAIGVNRYMGKPFQEAVLLETIQELVSTDEP
jgi:chemosensory pili system protein ChpA (sensor histidine kinase/response regulator)